MIVFYSCVTLSKGNGYAKTLGLCVNLMGEGGGGIFRGVKNSLFCGLKKFINTDA